MTTGYLLSDAEPGLDVSSWLGPTATNGERLEGLAAIGLSDSEIAAALGVAPATVRLWRTGRSKPRPHRALALDDLRAAAATLLGSGLGAEHVSSWLTSRNPRLRSERPLELIGRSPREVLAAADAEFKAAAESSGDRQLDGDSAALVPILGADGRPLEQGDRAYTRLEVAFRGVSTAVLKRLADEPQLLRQLHWRDFEQLVAELFRRDGFEVELTPRGGDSGVDLFAARRIGLGTVLYAVECKRYSRPIGPDFVRQLAWVVERHRATGGVLATTSRFTRGAVEEQRQIEFRMTLADYSELRTWLSGRPIL